MHLFKREHWKLNNEYIPEICFIDHLKFSNHEEPYKFLINVAMSYGIHTFKNFLEEKSYKFYCQNFANTIVSKIIKK